MKHCKECGSKLREDARFCGNCGKHIEEQTKKWFQMGKKDLFLKMGLALVSISSIFIILLTTVSTTSMWISRRLYFVGPEQIIPAIRTYFLFGLILTSLLFYFIHGLYICKKQSFYGLIGLIAISTILNFVVLSVISSILSFAISQGFDATYYIDLIRQALSLFRINIIVALVFLVVGILILYWQGYFLSKED